MKIKWNNILEDDDVEIEIDGDESKLLPDDDKQSGDDQEKTKELKQENQENEVESEQESQDEEKKPRRRINRAERRTKVLIDKLKQQEEHYKAELAKIRDEFSVQKNTTNFDAQIADINNKLNQAKQKLAKAKENSDYVAEADAQAELAGLALDLRLAQAAKKSAPTETKTEESKPIQERRQPEIVEYPDAYLDWVEENQWFESPESKDERILKRFVLRKAQELQNELDYTAEDDELYEELNNEIKKFVKQKKLKVDGFELPEEDAKTNKGKKSPVNGGRDSFITQSKDGKTRIHLTAEEKLTADRLGVDYASYAKQKIQMSKQNKSGYMNVFGD